MAITGYNVLQDAKTIKDIKTKQNQNSQDILDINEQLGDMTQVPTTSKTASGAITELFTNVSNGKTLVGTAITDVDNSVVVPTEPTFGDLASAIGGISTGKKWASNEGVGTSKSIVVSGLAFRPSIVILRMETSPGNSSAGSIHQTVYVESDTTHSTVNLNGRWFIFNKYSSGAGQSNTTPISITDDGFSAGIATTAVGPYGYLWLAFE